MATKDQRPTRAEDEELLARFLATRAPDLREALILRYVPLVHFVLGRLGLTPSLATDYEDYASQGLMGLIDAVDRFNPSFGAQFSTYATQRVRGQIIDRLRAADWMSRTARRRTRDMQAAVNELWSRLQRDPTDDELAQHLNLDLAQLRQTLQDASRVMVSLDAASGDEPDASLHEVLADHEHAENADPSETLADEELRGQLAAALHTLPKREQMMLSLYYVEELTLKEVGQVLELSESRVCQLHARAIMLLRAIMLDEPPAPAAHPAPRAAAVPLAPAAPIAKSRNAYA